MIELKDLLEYTNEDKLKLFNALVLFEIHRNEKQKYATPLCNNHVIDVLRELAVSEGIISCPYCGSKVRK